MRVTRRLVVHVAVQTSSRLLSSVSDTTFRFPSDQYPRPGVAAATHFSLRLSASSLNAMLTICSVVVVALSLSYICSPFMMQEFRSVLPPLLVTNEAKLSHPEPRDIATARDGHNTWQPRYSIP